MEIFLTILASFVFFALIMAAMAVGVMAGRKPIGGSCGGLAPNGSCSVCGKGAGEMPVNGDCPSSAKS